VECAADLPVEDVEQRVVTGAELKGEMLSDEESPDDAKSAILF
jgi:hypothetical protein